MNISGFTVVFFPKDFTKPVPLKFFFSIMHQFLAHVILSYRMSYTYIVVFAGIATYSYLPPFCCGLLATSLCAEFHHAKYAFNLMLALLYDISTLFLIASSRKCWVIIKDDSRNSTTHNISIWPA